MRRVLFSYSGRFSCAKEEMRERLLCVVEGLYSIADITVSNSEDVLEAGVYFSDVPTRFTFKGNTLTMEVDSTMVGPGYHAAMLEFGESLEETAGLRWDKDSARDDTGYYGHRNFKLLQTFMRDWLLEYSAQVLLAPPEERPVRTNLTMPYAMLPQGNEYFACHGLGYMNRDFFSYIYEFPEPELFCKSFFIWWEQGANAGLYLKSALSAIWCRINWLPPELEEEYRYFNSALKALESVWEMDKSLPLPVPEWIEMAKLTHNQELANTLIRRFPTEINQPPVKGYLRHDILHFLGGNKWSIRLPGKMHKSIDDDGSILFWDNMRRSIRISAASGMDKAGNPLPGMTLASNCAQGLNAQWHILPAAGACPVSAFILHAQDADGGGSSTLFAARDGYLLEININYGQREQKDWALAVCDSLTAL